jgi:hypothetical protein
MAIETAQSMHADRRHDRRLSIAALACGLVCSGPLGLQAQRLTGTVSDAGVRVPGAVVMLVSPTGDVAARTITREGGAFSLTAGGPGRYSVRVLRIGFRPTVAGPFDLVAGGTRTVDVPLTGRIVTLPEVRVTDRSECRLRPDSQAVAFQLWDEARKSLLAAALSSSRTYGVRITRSDRTLDRDGRRVVSDSTTTREGMSANPIVSLPPDSLLKVGYVSQDKSGGTTYWGPDAAVLLDDSFAGTHCIRTQAAPADSGALRGVVGVAFEPRRRDDKSDIQGVLWLDQETAELRMLDYSYVNVPPAVTRGGAGGHVEFLRLPDGGWTVSRWSMRFPVVATRLEHEQSTIPGVPSTTRPVYEIVGFRLSAGDLLELRRGGDVLWERGRVSATIRVVDSASGAAIRGALVSLNGGRSALATAGDGTVRFDRVIPGPASVDIRLPELDSLGVPSEHVPVTIPDHAFEPIVAAIESPMSRFIARCGARAIEWDEGAVRGVVPSAQAGRPLEVTWQVPFARLGGGDPVMLPEARRVSTDSTGAFFLCGVPRDVPVTLRVLGVNDPALTRVVRVDRRSLVAIADLGR